MDDIVELRCAWKRPAWCRDDWVRVMLPNGYCFFTEVGNVDFIDDNLCWVKAKRLHEYGLDNGPEPLKRSRLQVLCNRLEGSSDWFPKTQVREAIDHAMADEDAT